MPFELRNPGGLWLLTLLLPLVALYLLKVRRRRLRVSSTWLWNEAERDLSARSPWRRLVAQVPLILQLVALALLSLSLSGPATRGSVTGGDYLALVIDTSASMGARSRAGTTRMAEARRAAQQVLSGLRPGAQAIIVEASRDARIASALERDTRRLAAVVGQLQARQVEGELGAAVALASDRLRRLPGTRRLVVITDGAAADLPALDTGELPMQLIQVGEPLGNAAVIRMDVRGGVDPVTRREQVQAFALIGNYGTERRDLFVTLRQKDVTEPLASRRVQLEPDERAPVVLTFEPTPADRGTGLLIELSPEDALATDDRAYARVPEGQRIPVVMAPKAASPWLRRALLADADVEVSSTSVEALDAAHLPHDALVVVDGTCPDGVYGVGLLVHNPPPGRCRTAIVGRTLDAPGLTSWNKSDPRMRYLTLDGLRLKSARLIEPEGRAQSLVRTRDGTIISDISLPGRTGTLIGFDVGESNWPLQASFVLFIRNVVELARAQRARGIVTAARTGEPLTLRVPAGVAEVTAVQPDGETLKLTARDGLAIVPEVARAGFYHISWQQPEAGSVLIAANLASAAESDIRPRPAPPARTGSAVTAAADLEAHRDWDWLVAALALLLITLDVWWLTRRPRQVASLQSSLPRLPERAIPRRRSA